VSAGDLIRCKIMGNISKNLAVFWALPRIKQKCIFITGLKDENLKGEGFMGEGIGIR
jgi:hypothetical protein